MQDNGFTVNPLKCEWAVKETDWLGYWLTPTGLKPWKKKVDAILKMDRPRSLKEMRSFLGAVNYYRDVWPKRAHILAPLSNNSGAKKFIWTPEMQKAFEQMKSVLIADAFMAYPNHNKPFEIETDASDYQMGAVIKQDNQPVAYWSRKLTGAQKNYTTMEKELLSIVMVLKEFRTMLLGANITIFTDHKNLTFKNLTTQRVLRWRCYLEEYSPTIKYLEGPKNVLADCYSRLGRLDDNPASALEGKKIDIDLNPSDDNDVFHSVFDEPELFESYLNLPEIGIPDENPMNYEWMKTKQDADVKLQQLRNKFPQQYILKRFNNDVDLICHVKPGEDANTQWKIALAEAAIIPTIKWFHQVLNHPGSKRLRLTLQQRYHHLELRRHVDKYTCEACQRHKLDGPGYGLLPERDVNIMPWEEVAVDLIGPWTINLEGRSLEFNALTCIDPVTNLVELIRIDRKTAEHIRTKFEQAWLARYPWPKRCIHDNGGEFTGAKFQQLLELLGIKDVPTTSRNPQSNAICERMHQTVGNILRTLLNTNIPNNLAEANDIIDDALATAMHAMRAGIASSLNSAPGALAFGRDMFLNVPLIADWHLIATRREHLVNEALRRQNQKRRSFDYVPGQKVLKKMHNPTKIGPRTLGPYEIAQVHVNGTLSIILRQGVIERINIRRVIPYKE